MRLFYFIFDLLPKRHHANPYPPNCIIKFKYYFNRPILKHNIFTRHPKCHKKSFTFFFHQVLFYSSYIDHEKTKFVSSIVEKYEYKLLGTKSKK